VSRHDLPAAIKGKILEIAVKVHHGSLVIELAGAQIKKVTLQVHNGAPILPRGEGNNPVADNWDEFAQRLSKLFPPEKSPLPTSQYQVTAAHRPAEEVNPWTIKVTSVTEEPSAPPAQPATFLTGKGIFIGFGISFLVLLLIHFIKGSAPIAAPADTNIAVSTVDQFTRPRASVARVLATLPSNPIPSNPGLDLEQINTNAFVNPLVKEALLSLYGLQESLKTFGSAKNWISVDDPAIEANESESERTDRIVTNMRTLLRSLIEGGQLSWPTNAAGMPIYAYPIPDTDPDYSFLPREDEPDKKHPLGEPYVSAIKSLILKRNDLLKIYNDPIAAQQFLDRYNPHNYDGARPLDQREERFRETCLMIKEYERTNRPSGNQPRSELRKTENPVLQMVVEPQALGREMSISR
jgi:hypothetical protein